MIDAHNDVRLKRYFCGYMYITHGSVYSTYIGTGVRSLHIEGFLYAIALAVCDIHVPWNQ